MVDTKRCIEKLGRFEKYGGALVEGLCAWCCVQDGVNVRLVLCCRCCAVLHGMVMEWLHGDGVVGKAGFAGRWSWEVGAGSWETFVPCRSGFMKTILAPFNVKEAKSR